MKEESKDLYGDYAIVRVPEKERRSTLALIIEWTSVVTCVAAVWGGGVLGVAGDALTIITAVIIGSIILAIIGGLLGLVGGHTRAATYNIMRYPFGRFGSSLVGVICSGIGAMAWFAYQTWLFGVLVSTMLPGYWFTEIVAATIWSGVLMTLTSLYGIAAIITLSYLCGPMFLLLTFIGSVAAFDAFGGIPVLLAATPPTPMPFGTLITIVVGFYAVGAVIVPDLARYGTKTRDGAVAWTTHIMLFNTTLVLIGAFSVMLTGSHNIADAMLKIGMGVSALVFFAITQFDTNDNNLWGSSLSWVNAVGGRLSRRHWVAIMGAIGIIWAATIAAGYGASMVIFGIFADFLGKTIPQMGIIIIADFFVFKPYVVGLKDPATRYTFGPGTKYSLVNLAGIISWIIASLLSHFIAGPLGIAPVIMGMTSGFLLYLIIATACHKSGIKYELGEWVERPTGF